VRLPGIGGKQPYVDLSDARPMMPTPSRYPLFLVLAVCILAAPAQAYTPSKDNKPYDDRLMRLSEILGAVHFLRELCGANEGQYWRERMEELVRAEGASALRQAKLTRGFNQGYRNYARTYTSCTPTAQTTITRFMSEGAQISDTLIKTIP
jgi:uncharacterized protein (TIGR02301 family)